MESIHGGSAVSAYILIDGQQLHVALSYTFCVNNNHDRFIIGRSYFRIKRKWVWLRDYTHHVHVHDGLLQRF